MFYFDECRLGESVGLIQAILNVDEEIFFYLKEYKIKSKIKQINSLEIKETENFFYKNYNDLTYKNAQFCLKYDQYKVIQIRYLHFKI